MTPICLVIPPSPFLLDERVFMSLGILRMAAVLEQAGVPVEVVDLSGIENFTEAIRAHALMSPARVFGITSTTPQMPSAFEIAKAIKSARSNSRLILGGPHPTLVAAAWKKEKSRGVSGRASHALTQLDEVFDCIVFGDGEQAIFRAISDSPPKHIDADDPKTSYFLTNERLNELPFPARHLVDMDSYHYSIDGARAT